jgi:hypothetical protein
MIHINHIQPMQSQMAIFHPQQTAPALPLSINK